MNKHEFCLKNCGKITCPDCSVHINHEAKKQDTMRFETLMYKLKHGGKVNL